MNKDEIVLKPILKWAGGKRQIIQSISAASPKEYNTYYEPFFGGGAVLFNLQPHKAVINDVNPELINMYETIKAFPCEVIDKLKEHRNNHSREYFYTIRNIDRDINMFNQLSSIEKAARTIYLNKTCFNGLYRVNRNGLFNTPMGRYKNPTIVDEVNILNVSEYLNSNEINICMGDFEQVMDTAKNGDFVYLDPPYYPVSKTSSFVSYTDNGFFKEDQTRLKRACDRLHERGAKLLLSNSDCDFIKNLFSDDFYHINIIPVKRVINSDGKKRQSVNEVLISNY